MPVSGKTIITTGGPQHVRLPKEERIVGRRGQNNAANNRC